MPKMRTSNKDSKDVGDTRTSSQQGYRPGLPEAIITSNGYYNRNTSEKCILTGDYPVISSVLNGEAGVLPLPQNAMEGLVVVLPNLPLPPTARTVRRDLKTPGQDREEKQVDRGI